MTKMPLGGDTPLRDAANALADNLERGMNSLLIQMDGNAGTLTMELRVVGPEGEKLAQASHLRQSSDSETCQTCGKWRPQPGQALGIDPNHLCACRRCRHCGQPT